MIMTNYKFVKFELSNYILNLIYMYRSFSCMELIKSYYLMGVIVFMAFLYASLFRLFVFNDEPMNVGIVILFVPL